MTVYIAAPFVRRDVAKAHREILAKNGVLSTATWLDTHLSDYTTPPDILRREALEDLLDIHRADGFVLLDYWKGEGRGMFVELGFALAKGKPVWVVGAENNCIFYHHPNVRVVNDLNAIKEAA